MINLSTYVLITYLNKSLVNYKQILTGGNSKQKKKKINKKKNNGKIMIIIDLMFTNLGIYFYR